MSSKTKLKVVNAAKGRRYTTKEKAEIIAYVDKVNSEKGRGGQSAASKKYKISPLTISSWIRSGIGLTVDSPTPSSSSTSGPIGKKLAKLQSLHDQIVRSEKDLAKIRLQFEKLKSTL